MRSPSTIAAHLVPEASFQGAVIELAELHGWKVAHFHDSRRQVRPGVFVGDKAAAGYPDLTLARERVIWAELKGERGRLTPAQRDWLQRLEAAGGECHVWRPSDWPTITDVLVRRRQTEVT